MATVEGTIGATIHSIVEDVEELLRSELRLARMELRRELADVVKSMALASLGLGLALLAIAFALLAVLFALRGHLPSWLAALLVGALAAIISATLLQAARSYAQPALPRALATFKEDLEWAKQQPR
jgi:uncharacterized membrane protein YqjE